MPQTNIVFFTGPNRVFLRRDLDKWIELFSCKYGEYNISRLDSESAEKSNIRAELTTPVFLGEKRLIVLEWIPASTSPRDSEGDTEIPNAGSLESDILASLDRIPDTTIVLFIASEPDKRKALYKKLLVVATLKEYPILEWGDLRDYVRRRLPHIDISAASRLIEYAASDINRIESEIDKLSLYKEHDWITEEDIRANMTPNIEASVFGLTDAILLLDVARSHTELIKILESHSIHEIFSRTISTLRPFLYLTKLLDMQYTGDEIKGVLGMKPFVFDKMRKSARMQGKIRRFFEELISLDRKMKTGEGIGDAEDALRIGMEKAILRLQKN